MRRRKLLAGLGGLAGASGAVAGSGAFSSVTANRDLTVNVAGDSEAFLKLTQSPGANGAYASDSTANDGQLALDFSETAEGGQGLGSDSVYDFDDVFRVTNQGTQPVYVWGTFDGASGDFSPSGTDTDIWLYPGESRGTKLRDDDDSVRRLAVGETLPVGVHVNTDDVTRDQALVLTLYADAERPNGAPGTTKPYPPISVSKAGEPTRHFHTLPSAAEYASSGEDVVVGIESGTYPRDELAIRFDDPGEERSWIEYGDLGSPRVTFTGVADSSYELTVRPDEFDLTDEAWSVTVTGQDAQSGVTGLTVGLSELFSATPGSDGLTFGDGGEQVTYPGDGTEGTAFEFSREGAANETLSVVPTPDASGIERVVLTTADGSLSFARPAALAAAPSVLGRDPRSVTIQVPDELSIEGRDGRPVIGHRLQLEPTPESERTRLMGLEFASERDDESVAVEPTGSSVSSLVFENTVFTAPADSNAAFNPRGVIVAGGPVTVNGLRVAESVFENRRVGIETDGDVELRGLEVTSATFDSNDYGLSVGPVTEGVVRDTTFRNHRIWGFETLSIDGLGLRSVDFVDNGDQFGSLVRGGFSFTSLSTSLASGADLASEIESDVNGDVGASGALDCEFTDNDKAVDGNDDLPVQNCTFTGNSKSSDVNEL